MQGSEFLERYGEHLDAGVTSVHPDHWYAVRAPTAHPVYENFRVQTFRQVLAAAEGASIDSHRQLEVLGELMLQSHGSYGRCKLGSHGTDRLVELVLEERTTAMSDGKEPALYGAKITGGGCGGTVCILGTADDAGETALQRVVHRYSREMGHSPQVFRGSSEGSVKFGVLRVRRRKAYI